jgi:hypothetical protein
MKLSSAGLLLALPFIHAVSIYSFYTEGKNPWTGKAPYSDDRSVI